MTTLPERIADKLERAEAVSRALGSLEFGFRKWIDRRHTGMAESRFVPTNNRQVVDLRRRGQKRIQDWNRLRQTQPPPLVCHPVIHGQEAIVKLGRNPKQPLLKCPGLHGVAQANTLDSLTYFSQHEHANEQFC
jgi:hypothetical protein